MMRVLGNRLTYHSPAREYANPTHSVLAPPSTSTHR